MKPQGCLKKNVAQFVKMNAEALEFKDNSFDLVSISESLHHIKDPIQVLKEIGRFLTPDGVFILQESISDEDQKKSRLSDVLIHEFIAKNDVLRGYYHRKFYTRQELIDMVEKSGFSIHEIFISQIPLKCALCKYLDYCTDTMSKRMINKGLREISASLNKIKEFSQYPDIKIQATALRKEICHNGYSPASVIFIIAKE
ncbi:MAG: methyltransferase domain-containing protein [Candidatus Hodarchaeota archaeon]